MNNLTHYEITGGSGGGHGASGGQGFGQETVGGAKGNTYTPRTKTDFGSKGGIGGSTSTPSQDCDVTPVNGSAEVEVHEGGSGGGNGFF